MPRRPTAGPAPHRDRRPPGLQRLPRRHREPGWLDRPRGQPARERHGRARRHRRLHRLPRRPGPDSGRDRPGAAQGHEGQRGHDGRRRRRPPAPPRRRQLPWTDPVHRVPRRPRRHRPRLAAAPAHLGPHRDRGRGVPHLQRHLARLHQPLPRHGSAWWVGAAAAVEQVDGSQAACGACHGLPPPSPPSHGDGRPDGVQRLPPRHGEARRDDRRLWEGCTSMAPSSPPATGTSPPRRPTVRRSSTTCAARGWTAVPATGRLRRRRGAVLQRMPPHERLDGLLADQLLLLPRDPERLHEDDRVHRDRPADALGAARRALPAARRRPRPEPHRRPPGAPHREGQHERRRLLGTAPLRHLPHGPGRLRPRRRARPRSRLPEGHWFAPGRPGQLLAVHRHLHHLLPRRPPCRSGPAASWAAPVATAFLRSPDVTNCMSSTFRTHAPTAMPERSTFPGRGKRETPRWLEPGAVLRLEFVVRNARPASVRATMAQT